MQFAPPLTLTLSPSEREREKTLCHRAWSAVGDATLNARIEFLSPSDGEKIKVRILRNHFSRLEPLNRPGRVGLGVLTPPPHMVDTLDGRGRVRTPSPTFRFVGRGSFNCIVKA